MKHTTTLLKTLFWMLVMVLALQPAKAGTGSDPGTNRHAAVLAATINGSLDVCVGQTVAYSCSDNSGFSYTWNAYNGSGIPSNTNSYSVLWNTVGTGMITVSVFDNLGNVINTANVNVTVHALPLPKITSAVQIGCGGRKGGSPNGEKDECLAACDSSYVTYTTPLNAGSTYSWNVTGAISYTATGNSITVHWGGVGSASLSVTETNQWGCIGTDEVCIKIVGTPKALFSTLPAAVGGVINACLNQPVNFFNLSTPGVGSNITGYQWYFGLGGQSTLQNPPPFSYNTAGTYTITLIVENECHCKDTFQQTINISSTPGPDITCASTVCADATSTYTTSAVCSVYNWTVTGGTINQSPPYGPTITVTWGPNGPGIVSLNVGTCAGMCPSTTSIVIPIIGPTATVNGSPTPCIGYNTYSITNIPGCYYQWTVPAGASIIGSDSSSSVNVYFPTGGISGPVTVTYYNPTLKCGGTGTLMVNVKPSFYVMGNTQVCENSTETYSTSGPGTFNWDVRDGLGNLVQSATGPSSIIVNWTFGPGNYTITVTNTGAQYCNSPQIINIKVNPTPPPPTVIFGPNSICPGSSYSYASTPTGNYYLLWNVTGGTPSSSTGNNITITWNMSGPYAINLYQVSVGQVVPCTSAAYNFPVTPITPSPAVITGLSSTCNNTTQVYNTSTVADQYNWTISPAIMGSVILGQGTPNATIQWNNTPGIATITLTTTLCNSSINSTYTVTLGAPPPPVITAPPSACEGQTVAFSTPTSGSAYFWDFGDGNTSTLQNPGHSYALNGTYNVNLTVSNPGGCAGNYTSVWLINVRPTPVANITTPDPNAFCTGQTISTTMYGTNLVLGNTYQWLQNGSSTGMPTGTTYNATNTGNFSLVVTNTFGCSDTSNIIPVTQAPCSPCNIQQPVSSSFTYSLQSPTCGTVNFTGVHSGTGINPSWNFDDPISGGSNVATGLTPTHTFINPGYYRVTFSVMFPNTAGTGYCRKDTIIVVTIPVVADFIYTLNCGTTPGTFDVSFTDNSRKVPSASITSWSWTITGATTASSTSQNPTIALNPGTHNVTFVINPLGGPSCQITKTVVIPNVATAAIGAASQVCFGNTIGFTNLSLGNITALSWTFGDGASSLISNPSRTYGAPGPYNVTLTVTDAYGCTSSTSQIINVTPNTLTGTINVAGPTTFCQGDSVALTAVPSGGTPSYSYLWSTVQTTQTIQAQYTGNYYVNITDAMGCKYRTPVVNVIVNPKPTVQIVGDLEYCLYSNVMLSADQGGNNTYDWYVNGSYYTSGPTFYQFANVTGNFNVTVVITTPNGCKDSAAVVVKIHPNPATPVITASNIPTCQGTPTVLTASGGAGNYSWNTGDTTASITVTNAGFYNVTTQNIYGCKATGTIAVNPLPDFSDLISGCYEFCDTADVPLIGPIAPGYTYQWYFNGNPIAGANGPYYNVPAGQSGTYTLEIKLNGCIAMSKDIEIDFIKCGGCVPIASEITNIQCGPVNGSGNQTYTFSIQINNPFASGTNYVMSSPQGVLSGLSPAVLLNGLNTVTGTFTDMPPVDGQLCIYGYLIDADGRRCEFKACKSLPKCEQEPCDAKVDLKALTCIGENNLGYDQYYFSLAINWPGSNGSIVTIASPNGTVSSVAPPTVNNGANTLTGIFTDVPPVNGQMCLVVYIYDPVTHLTCTKKVCKSLPHCPKEHCDMKVYEACPRCLERDVNGNWMYQFSFTVYNPTGSNMNILLTSPNGGFGVPSPAVAGPGNTPVTVTFTDYSPADTLICFTVILQHPQNTYACKQEVCIKLPDCRKLGIDKISSSETSLVNVYPNPAGSYATIEHMFEDLQNRTITLSDLTGRNIEVFENLQGAGKIELNTAELASGMYLINVYENGKKAGFKRLMVVKN